MSTNRNTAITSNQIAKHTLIQEDISPDALSWQEPVEDKDLTAPPSSGLAEGDRYIVGDSATGAWTGEDDNIAQYVDGSWSFYTPIEGWFAWIKDEDKLYYYTGSAWAEFTSGVGSTIGTLNFIIDGGGSAITTGVKGYVRIPFACTINRVTLLADQSGSIKIDIWKDTYANYPPTNADTITGANEPEISSGTKDEDSTLTSWATSISADDILGFNVDSSSTIEKCTVCIKYTRT